MGYLIAQYLGKSSGESFFLGCLLSLSSTAIVLRVLDQNGESNSPHARAIVGILVFQDIVAIPMMLVTPMLGDSSAPFDADLLIPLAKGLAILFIVVVAALKLVPSFCMLLQRLGVASCSF